MTNTENTEGKLNERQEEVPFESPVKGIEAFADKAKESEDFENAIRTLVNAREEVDSGPLTIMLQLKKVYGPDLEGFPIPDSDDEESNQPQGKVKVPYLKQDGNWGSRKQDWYMIFAHATGFGGEQFRKYEQLKEAKKDSPDETKIPCLTLWNCFRQAIRLI
jgi:hypothetical protein